MTSPEELADGLSATQRGAVVMLAGRQFYPRMLAATKDRLMRLGIAERAIGDAIRLTDLGRQVAEELQKQKPDA